MKSLRVLLLEDHELVASAVTIGIANAGHHMIGPFQSCHAAMAAPADYDAAILDMGLPDGPPFAFALRLMERGLPFLFYTGSEPDDMPPALRDVPVFFETQHDAHDAFGAGAARLGAGGPAYRLPLAGGLRIVVAS